MSLGEQLYLALVLLAFATFSVTLAVVTSETKRYIQRRADQASERNPDHLNKAA